MMAMIERHAPTLMRAGSLVSLTKESPFSGKAIPSELMARIVTAYQSQVERGAVNLHAIARATGLHYQTIVRHTRHLRAQQAV